MLTSLITGSRVKPYLVAAVIVAWVVTIAIIGPILDVSWFWLMMFIVPAAIIMLIALSQNLWLGVVAVAILAPLNDLQRIPGIPAISAIKLIGLLMLLVFAGQAAVKRRRIRLTNVGWPLLMLALTLLIASLLSLQSRSVMAWTSMLSYLLFFLIAVNEVRSSKQIDQIARLSVLMAGAVGVFAVLQFFLGRTIFPPWLLNYAELRFAGAEVTRVLGTATNSNAGALVPALALPLAAALLSGERSRKWQLLLTFAIIFMVLHLALSFSRSAWIGAAGGLLFLLLILGRSQVRWILLLLALLALAALALSFVDLQTSALLSRLESINLSANQDRIDIYSVGLEIFRDNFLFGVGLQNFGQVYSEYVGTYKTPHNMFIATVAQGGLMAFLSLVWIGAATVFNAIRVWKVAPIHERILHMALLAGLVSWWVMGLFNSYLMWIGGWILIALLAAHASVVMRLEPDLEPT